MKIEASHPHRKRKIERIHNAAPRKEKLGNRGGVAQGRYGTLIENMPCAVYSALSGATGPTTFMFEKWKDLTGYSPEELCRDPEAWARCIHPDDRNRTVDTYAGLWRHEAPYELEYRMIHKDTGHARHVRDRSFLSKDGEGVTIRVDGIVTDITEQRRVEDALRGDARLNQILLDSMPCVALLIRPHTREIVASNEAAVKVGAVPGKTCYQTWGQSQTPCPWCSATELWATGKAQHCELEGLGCVWDTHWVPVSDDLYMHYAFDITERKLAERELNLFFNLVPDMVCIASTDGYFKKLNSEWERVLGYNKEDMLDIPFLDLVHPRDREATLKEVSRQVDGKSTKHFENRYRCKDGSYKWLEWMATPASDDGLLHAAARDITERKQAEERTRQHQAELAHVSRLCTIGQMASELAHELNQPLCAMLAHLEGCLSMIKSDSPDTDRIIEKLETAVKQTDRAGKIVSRVKGFAMRGQGKRSTVLVNDVVRDATEFAIADLRHKHITVESDMDEKIRSVFADPIQIEQVVLNLIHNASDAMKDAPKEHRKLTIGTRMLANAVEVIVKDTGKGIDKADASSVFESFVTTKPEGLGVGLSICQSIVESHGGRIFFTNNPDRGVTFCFTLPLRAEII